MSGKELQILAEMNSCVHFNGVFVNDSCKAGVNYHGLMGDGPGCFREIPCLNDRNSTVQCAKRQFATREEAELLVAEEEAIMETLAKAIIAAKEDARSIGLGVGRGGRGTVQCPKCGGVISYSVASVNGHMHAVCSTQGCVRWME